MEKLNDIYSVSLLFILLCNCLFIVGADVGDRAKAECRKYGETMVECQRKLHGVKTRVPADMLDFPHMVMVGYKINGSDEISYQCGGSLISPMWVLSAAHCIGDSRTGPPVRVRLGTTTLEAEEQEEDLIQERSLVNLIVHPEYKPPAKYNDIALLEMDKPIDLDGDVRIACLQVEESKQLFTARASGFGKTKFDNTDGSQTMMHVDLEIIPEKQCNASLRSMIRRGGVLKQGIVPSQICAGDLHNGGKDTCQGDSGGPLQFLPENPDCISTFHLYVILGVTSFGRFCGFRNSPGVYTRVSYYVDWIENIVWPEQKESTTEQSTTEKSTTEQSNTEKSTTEQSNTEKSTTEQSNTEKSTTEQSTTEQSTTENNTEKLTKTPEIITETTNNKEESSTVENKESSVPSSESNQNIKVIEKSDKIVKPNEQPKVSDEGKGTTAVESQPNDNVTNETNTNTTTEIITESSAEPEKKTSKKETTTNEENKEIKMIEKGRKFGVPTGLIKKSQDIIAVKSRIFKTISNDVLDDDDDFNIENDDTKYSSPGLIGTVSNAILDIKPISTALSASQKRVNYGRSWVASWMVPLTRSRSRIG